MLFLRNERYKLGFNSFLTAIAWGKFRATPVRTGDQVEPRPMRGDYRAMLRVLRLVVLAMMATCSLVSAAQAEGGRRVALIIGNAQYDNWRGLKNPLADAKLIHERLKSIGFDEFVEVENGTNARMRAGLREFERKADGADLALIFYSGHGAQVGPKSYVISTDALQAAQLQPDTADNDGIDIRNLIGAAKRARAGIVLIDACREVLGAEDQTGPGGATRSAGSQRSGIDLNRSLVPQGVLVQISTRPGMPAYDGLGDNSLYAIALDENLKDVHVEVRTLLKKVADAVYKASDPKQEPSLIESDAGSLWITLALDPEPARVLVPPSPQEVAAQKDEGRWTLALQQNNRDAYLAYLKDENALRRREAEAALSALAAKERAHLTGTADEAARALATIQESEWRTLFPGSLAAKIVNAATVEGLRLLSDERKDHRASIILAAMHDEGLGGLGRSPAQAVILYARAAEAGNATAQRIMGEFSRFGRDGIPIRADEAARLYALASLGGDALAQDRLGSMYADGLLGEKLRNKALEYFELAAAQDYAWAQCHLGTAYSEGALGARRDDKKATELIKRSAIQGNYCGEMALGHMYLFGEHGIEKDPKRGAEYYLEAAKQGYSAAQTSMGILYQTGQGVDRSITTAVTYFELAAKQGYAHAQFLLGVLYAKGEDGAAPDLRQAVAYFQSAAAQQFHPAEAALGWAHSEGLGGLAPNPDEAARLFKKAADGEDPEGLYRLGYATFNGHGVAKSPADARRLMQSSAAKGFAAAERWLNGQGR